MGCLVKPTAVLIVEDSQTTAETVRKILTKEGYDATVAATGNDAAQLLAAQPFPVCILDLGLPDVSGEELLAKWSREYPEMAIIILTANHDVTTAVRCVKTGAFDFLLKPFDRPLLLKTLDNALRHRELTRKVTALTELTQRELDNAQAGGIFAESPAMRRTLEMADMIAANGYSCVLITGESGVGKGLLARTIHKRSARRSRPFVEVNCSAMPANLVESELFGHQKGAFTDAKENRVGVFEMADGGTLFLDEIGDMDVTLQTKLLKVIEDQRFRRVGSAVEVSVDVAIIAATNQNIEGQAAAGRFRSDLYYRLNVVPLEIPPLRDRVEDIPPLANSFVEQCARKYGKALCGLTDDATAALQTYAWPGNVRELRNVIERACLFAKEARITASGLFLPSAARNSSGGIPVSAGAFRPMTLAQAEELAIRAAMKQADGNKNTAAEILQIHRTTLYKKLEEYKIASAP